MNGEPVMTLDGAEPAVIRPRASSELEVAPPSAAPRRFHASMPGYVRTPLRVAPETARRLGFAQVLVKDESARLGLPSFKVLGASWAVYRALAQRLGDSIEQPADFDALLDAAAALQPLTLSAATDGNHGRAVANMARLLGLEARIYVPSGTAKARIEAISGEGAKVIVVPGGYDDAVRRSAEDGRDRCLVISDTSWEGYEDVPRWVIEGYATIFSEIEDQLAQGGHRRPDVVMVPIGVGALAASAVSHFWSVPDTRPVIVGVEPTSAACVLESVAAGSVTTLDHPQDSVMAGLNCATPSLVAWPLVSRGIDVYIAVNDARVPEAMRLLARDGVTAGETGAAGLAGLLRVVDEADGALRAALSLNARTSVLLLCTEGATDPEAYRRVSTAAK
jgi:diaminopropionate ammonia-lyase